VRLERVVGVGQCRDLVGHWKAPPEGLSLVIATGREAYRPGAVRGLLTTMRE
jgi:hypothetical protein